MKIWDIFHPFGETSGQEFVVLSEVLSGKRKDGGKTLHGCRSTGRSLCRRPGMQSQAGEELLCAVWKQSTRTAGREDVVVIVSFPLCSFQVCTDHRDAGTAPLTVPGWEQRYLLCGDTLPPEVFEISAVYIPKLALMLFFNSLKVFPLETQQNPKQNPNINQCKCNYCNRPSSVPQGLKKSIDSLL